MKFRILQINSLLTGGGTDDQCVKLALGLHRLGQEVSIAGPDKRGYSKIIRSLGIPFHPTPPEGPLKLKFILRVAKLIRKHRIQIVHGHHGRDIWPTLLAARLSGVHPRIVLTRHMAKSPGTALSRSTLLRQCDALIAVSEFTRRVLSEGHHDPDSPEKERHHRPAIRGDKSKIKVVLGGIDTESFRPFDASALRQEWGLRHDDYVFAVAGGYSFPRGKGQREFLQAAALMHHRNPRARFLVIGRGDMADILKSDIAKLGLVGKAWLTPYCENMPAAMNAIDCLVHPQIGTESFGLVVIEAFACGKPVIASDLDGIPEAFAATGYGKLVHPEDIGALEAAMSEWTDKPPLNEGEKLAMHKKIERDFSFEALAKRVIKIYEGLHAR